MELCLLTAGATIRLGTIALTLAWTHSIEKARWEEDWRATPAGLVLEEDRAPLRRHRRLDCLHRRTLPADGRLSAE